MSIAPLGSASRPAAAGDQRADRVRLMTAAQPSVRPGDTHLDGDSIVNIADAESKKAENLILVPGDIS